ncbi:ABC transporter permease [Natribacillus halophilus]|uniref:ABC-2 type transport system permease protein n=1 Tax=Natribacillus halophilus TaxID=549003 RepID=A0A1G8NXF8_9BACI|nr:ABC transporter permease [Natribacillus halophilus]SDI84210.1 ABC-2 type transport system permease protein [Natribacillus halophilus]
MYKMLIVLAHTYWTKVKSKTFMFTTLMMAFFMVLFLNLDNIIEFFDGDASEQVYDVLILDESGDLYEPLAAEIEGGDAQIMTNEASQADEEDAEAAVMEGPYDAYLQVAGEDEDIEGHFYAPTVNETFLPSQLESGLQNVRETRVADDLDIDEEDLAALDESVAFQQSALDDTARSEAELNQARLFVNILLFIIYFSVLFLGNMIASEVATEKSSRVMELLISSASPVQQMFGKIFGVGLIGLTQYSLIFLIALVSFAQFVDVEAEADEMLGEQQDMFALGEPVFSLELFLYAFLFFILGYLLYATLAAMLGSIVTRIEDVGQAVGPMNMLVILAFMISIFSMGNPASPIVTITSYIPFFTPMIMFLRVGMGEATVWEVLLAVGVMVVTIVLLTLIAARVYRGGVLLYNHARTWKSLKQALLLARKNG